MESSWKCLAVGVICFVLVFIVAVQCSVSIEKTHIKNGHTPYLDANTGLMWQSHNIVE